jgi:hypothetical protein
MPRPKKKTKSTKAKKRTKRTKVKDPYVAKYEARHEKQKKTFINLIGEDSDSDSDDEYYVTEKFEVVKKAEAKTVDEKYGNEMKHKWQSIPEGSKKKGIDFGGIGKTYAIKRGPNLTAALKNAMRFKYSAVIKPTGVLYNTCHKDGYAATLEDFHALKDLLTDFEIVLTEDIIGRIDKMGQECLKKKTSTETFFPDKSSQVDVQLTQHS